MFIFQDRIDPVGVGECREDFSIPSTRPVTYAIRYRCTYTGQQGWNEPLKE